MNKCRAYWKPSSSRRSRMITTNFEDFPEHRLAFFKLLKATNTHCFAALFAIPPEHHKLVVDSVVWAFKHTERDRS